MPRSLEDRANVTPDALRTRAALCHLSAVLGFVVPFAGVLAPYLAWRRYRGDGAFVDGHGRDAVEVNLAYLSLEAVLFGVVLLAGVLGWSGIVVPAVAAVLLVLLAHAVTILYAALTAHRGDRLDLGFRLPVLADDPGR